MSLNDLVGLYHLIAGPGGGLALAAAVIMWANYKGIWIFKRELANEVTWRDIRIKELEARLSFLEEEKHDYKQASYAQQAAAETFMGVLKKAGVTK